MTGSILRRDWAGMQWNGRAERRWTSPKTWGASDWRWARGVACDLLIGAEAHDRLVEIWRSVRSIDDAAYGALRAEAGDGEWTADLSRRFVRSVVARLQHAGVADGGPMWIAVERAAIRAASRARDRQKVYGWTRPYGPRDVVTTIRLPFGAWRERPLRAAPGSRWDDPGLLHEFEIREVPRWAEGKEDWFSPRPDACDYAECAMLSGGWAIRFVAVRPAAERGLGPGAEADLPAPP